MANQGVQIPNLDWIKQTYPLIGEAMEEFANLHNNMGQKLSVNPQGKTDPPPPHTQVSAVGANGVIHVTVDNGNNPRTRGLHNWFEYDTDPNFGNAQAEHLFAGTQRRIPTMTGSTIYVRSYTMYQDSAQRSAYRYTAVNDGLGSQTYLQATGTPPTGTTSVTATLPGPAFPASKGSGTSPTPGEGFGREQFVSVAGTPGKPPKVFR
jgi:hypothetical protein